METDCEATSWPNSPKHGICCQRSCMQHPRILSSPGEIVLVRAVQLFDEVRTPKWPEECSRIQNLDIIWVDPCQVPWHVDAVTSPVFLVESDISSHPVIDKCRLRFCNDDGVAQSCRVKWRSSRVWRRFHSHRHGGIQQVVEGFRAAVRVKWSWLT